MTAGQRVTLWSLDIQLIVLCLFYLWLAPFTKVEESFNLQAIHDFIFLGIRNLSEYDHQKFPGAVPRTCIGAAVVSIVSYPFSKLFNLSPFHIQILARSVIGLANAFALIRFRQAVSARFGYNVAKWYALLQCTQFHSVFYSSRPLPNILGLPLVSLAFADLVNGRTFPGRAFAKLAFAAIVFRSEIALLIAFLGLQVVFSGNWSTIKHCILYGLYGLVGGFMLSLIVDSWFWQTFPMVPEISGFVYNVLEGKSSDWGVEPWYAYFVKYLPKLLLNPLSPVFILYSLFTDRRIALMLFAPLGFIAMYSLLPHKEWRFIVYVVPLFTVAAASGIARIRESTSKRKSTFLNRSVSLLLASSVAMSLVASMGMAYISSLNYPGGYALLHANNLRQEGHIGSNITLHMDVYTCMTGASRFGYVHSDWIYDKTEQDDKLADMWPQFDVVIAEIDQGFGGVNDLGSRLIDESLANSELIKIDSVYAYSGINRDALKEFLHTRNPLSLIRNVIKMNERIGIYTRRLQE